MVDVVNVEDVAVDSFSAEDKLANMDACLDDSSGDNDTGAMFANTFARAWSWWVWS